MMNAKKYFAQTAREALRRIKEELGADAVVLSNRSVEGGVEITAVLSSEIGSMEAAQPVHRAAPTLDIDDDFTVSLSAASGGPAPARPASARAKPETRQDVREWVPSRTARREATPASRPGVAPAAAVTPAAALEAVGTPAQQGQLLGELAAIRGLIEQQLAGFAWGDLARAAPAKTLLLADLLDAGFSAQLARRLVEGLSAEATREEGRNWLKGVLGRSLMTVGTDEEIIDRGGVYALVGPTGVGKTTTTAKLAARCVVRHGAERVALLTTDGYRIGAHEQLRIYGRILGVQVHAVRDGADLRQTLAELTGKHMVLIDTIGMSQRDRLVAEQAAMLNSVGGVKRLLLLNATCRGDTLDDVVHAYGGADLAGAVLTKVDEAASLAPALDALIRHNLELYYVANGQRVPEDLHLPNRPYLLHRALKELPESSPHRLAGDEAGLLLASGAARAEAAMVAQRA
jgi:flagellar biosynthesis protein FlhF